jgi:hypothetical protein
MSHAAAIVSPRIDRAALAREIDRVREGQAALAALSTADLLALWSAVGREIASPECAGVEGIAFLSTWLREKNLRHVLEVNFGSLQEALERFAPCGTTRLRAAPRGVAAHWVAGNIPTLALFSLALSTLARNANLIRVPQASLAEMEILAGRIAAARADGERGALAGQVILDATSLFSFPSSDVALNEQMSLAADVRVVWGGHEAVAAVTRLPRQEHCEDVVLGPKFSLAVVDAETVADPAALARCVQSLAKDVVLFEQAACSSPHIVFIEGDLAAARRVGEAAEGELIRLAKRSPMRGIDEGTAAAILRTRAEYALGDATDLAVARDLSYTVLIDEGARLSEGLQARTLFVRAIGSLDEALPLLSPKIQTIGVAIADAGRRERFCEEAAARGVSRLVRLGLMNVYDTPWDGMRICDRLVRWASANC